MLSKTIKSILLFLVLIGLIQIFYAVSTNTDLFSAEKFIPYGFAIQIIYYSVFLTIVFLFVGKFDFKVVGLKRVTSWKKYLLVGMSLALLMLCLKVVFISGTFGQGFFTVPYYVLVPTFLVMGTLIGLAEESAFRGYILKNFLEKYKPLTAILLGSFLFGIYHINIAGLNYYTATFWGLYVLQALTGGIIMALLFYRTGGNLIAPIAYHSTNIIVGQLILWTATSSASYVLAVEIIINLLLTAVLVLLPKSLLPIKSFKRPTQATEQQPPLHQ
jgi:membrane protease YdiL (CAAX protease family)